MIVVVTVKTEDFNMNVYNGFFFQENISVYNVYRFLKIDMIELCRKIEMND